MQTILNDEKPMDFFSSQEKPKKDKFHDEISLEHVSIDAKTT